MKMQRSKNTQLKNQCRLHNKILLASTLVLSSFTATADDKFQMNALFAPHDAMLAAEEKGRIMIYDGLESETIDRAMDEQFKRIANMMFVRIRYKQDNDEYIIEEDGCD